MSKASHASKQGRSLVVAKTVVSKAGAVMRVTKLQLSEEADSMLRSRSRGILSSAESQIKGRRAERSEDACLATS